VFDVDIMTWPLNPLTILDLLKPMPTGQGMVIIAGMQKSGTLTIAILLGVATGQTVCSDRFYRLSDMKVDFRKELYIVTGHIAGSWFRERTFRERKNIDR
jgi:hypothetical protein